MLKKKNKLTDRQKEILDFVKKRIKRDNFPPTIKDICIEFGFASTNGVHQVLTAIEKKGYIKRVAKGASRGLKILKKGKELQEATEENKNTVIATNNIDIINITDIEEKKTIDLDKDIFGRKESTFVYRVGNMDFQKEGFIKNDLLTVDKKRNPKIGDCVIAKFKEDIILRAYQTNLFGFELSSPIKKVAIISSDNNTDLEILGVVSGLVRTFKK